MTRAIHFLIIICLLNLATPVHARKWTDHTGAFSVEAAFVAVADGKVRLRRADDGQTISVPIAQLSAADRLYVQKLTQKTPGKNPPKLSGTRQVLAALDQKTNLEFKDTPLNDLMEFIGTRHNIPYFIDKRSLERANISDKTPLTVSATSVGLADGLNKALNAHKIHWTVSNSLLLITSQRTAERHLETLVYETMKDADPDNVIREITSKVAPQSWEDVGGPATISFLPSGLYVVSQSTHSHRLIRQKYKNLLQAVALDTDRIVEVPGKKLPIAVLKAPTQLSFARTPLRDIVAYLKDVHKIDMQLDASSLDDIGLTDDTPVSIDVRGIPLASALTVMLSQLDLAWTADENAITITSRSGADQLFRADYPLAGDGPDFLIDALSTAVSPSSWSEVGGKATIELEDGELAIKQSLQPHLEISRLLADMRTAHSKK